MKLFEVLKDAGKDFMADKAMRLSAALAYYSVFSLAPMLIVSISIAGAIFGEDAARGAIKDQLSGAVGEAPAETIQGMINGASRSGNHGVMALVGVAILLVSASGVFAQLKDAMNTVWNIQAKPGRGWLAGIKDRVLSLAMVGVIGFLLLISLILSAILTFATTFLEQVFSIPPILLEVINSTASVGITTVLFAMIFKILPDATIRWRDVWAGAFITSCLFTVGKILLALYLGRGGAMSAYGAAGALVLILSWVYYSANILLFGAEITQVMARMKGRKIVPTKAAISLPEHQIRAET